MANRKRRIRKVKPETIFLSGTDRVQDAIHAVYKAVKRMGFRPWWFRQPDFPHFAANAMDNCLTAARQCDRMVVVIDERAGLSYRKTGKTITEAEFDEAHARGVPCLVFVRARVWHQSRVYHKRRSDGLIFPEDFKRLGLDGDQAVFELIEKLQHLTKDGEPCVPWITSFENPDDIVRAIKGKWVVSDEEQLAALAVIQSAALQTFRNEPVRPIRIGNVSISPETAQKLRSILSNELIVSALGVAVSFLAGGGSAAISGSVLSISVGALKLVLERIHQSQRLKIVDVKAEHRPPADSSAAAHDGSQPSEPPDLRTG